MMGDDNAYYLPFNLSSVVPFEATAAALRALPTVQPRMPAAVSFLSDVKDGSNLLDDETQRQMHAMLSETAAEGGWMLGEDEAAGICSTKLPDNAPKWVSDMAYTLPRLMLENSATPRHVPAADTRPVKRPRPGVLTHNISAAASARCPEERGGVGTEDAPMGVDLGNEEAEDQRDAEIREAQASANELAAKRFARTLDGLVEQVDSLRDRSGEDLASAMMQVTGRTRYMAELMQNVQVHAQQGLVSVVAETTLRSIVDIMDVRVRAAAIAVRKIAQVPPKNETLFGAALGLRAASILMTLLTAPNAPRSLFLQDTLDEIVGLLSVVGSHILYPAFDPLYVLPESAKRTEKKKGGTEKGNSNRDDGSENSDKTEAGLPASRTGSGKGQASKPVSEILELFSVVCEKLADLLAQEKGLAESIVSRSLSFAVRALGVDGILTLHMSASRVIESIVASYQEHVDTVLVALLDILAKLPANRRSLRSYRIHNGSHVRVASALLIRVLNVAGASTSKPIAGSKRVAVGDAPDDLRRNCSILALRFVDQFLARAFRERDSELRTALQTLFGDILELYGSPEYPSAELIVQAFGVRLGLSLNNVQDLGVQGRVLCLDMLGALAARLCSLYGTKTLQALCDENIWSNEAARRQVMNHRVTVLAYLNEQGKEDTACAYAHLFHCTQFVVDDADACEEGSKLKQSFPSTVGDSGNFSPQRDGTSDLRHDAMQKSSLDLTRALRLLGATHEGARPDALSSALYLSQRRPLVRGLSRIIDAIRDGLNQPEPTLRAKAIKTLSVVAEADSNVLRCIPALLNAIEQSCGDVSKSVRESSLDLLSRSLSTLSGGDENSMRAERGSESAADAGEFFEKIFPIVQQRLLDSATSVRKRAISIMHGILVDVLGDGQTDRVGSASASRESRQTRENIAVRICWALADRLQDRETSVRVAAERTLQLAMFGCDQLQLEKVPSRVECERSATVLASRIVAVYTATLSNAKASPSQRNAISHVLHECIVVKRRLLLDLIVGELVEILHATEAQLAEAPKSLPPAGSGPRDCGDMPAHKRMELLMLRRVASIAALEAVAKVDPSLVAKHCSALASHLKGIVEVRQRGARELRHIPRILCIMEVCVPQAGRPFASNRLAEVIQDVEKIVCMCPIPAIAPAAIRCFCALARHVSDPELRGLPEDTARVFYSFLMGAKDELAKAAATSNSEAIRNAREALPRLGLLARHGDLGEEFVSEIYELLLFLCTKLVGEWMGPIHNSSTVASEIALMHMTGPRTKRTMCFPLRQSAIRSLIHFLARHRTHLPKAMTVLVACLRQGSADPDLEAQMTVLSGVQDMLLEEESRNVAEAEKIGQKRQRARPGANDDVVLAAEEDAEAGFLALCAQAIVPELDGVLLCGNAEIRKTVVTVLGLLGRQGLVLPATIVPALFRLLVDGSPQCRESALFVVGFLADRYPAMLSSAALRGVRTSFSHAMRTHVPPDKAENALVHSVRCAVDGKSGYALLSPGFLYVQRQHRRSILCSIVREFDPKAKTDFGVRTAKLNANPICEVDASEGAATSFGGMLKETGAASCSLNNATGDMNIEPSVGRSKDDEVRPPGGIVAGDGTKHSDDEDDNIVSRRALSGQVKLCARGATAQPLALAFYAATLATMDYGAGSGGCPSVGAGTSAADSKLKAAREDMLEVVGVASRIISNSGQAVLQAFNELCNDPQACEGEKADLARHALPLCMLLLVKRYLKETRLLLSNTVSMLGSSTQQKEASDVQDKNREDCEAGSTPAPMPHFDISRLQHPTLEGVASSSEVGLGVPVDIDATLLLFRELMANDSIEEAEAAAGASSRKRKPNRRSGRTMARRRTKPGVKRSKAGVKATAGRVRAGFMQDKDDYEDEGEGGGGEAEHEEEE